MIGDCPRGISDCDCGAEYCERRKRKAHARPMTLDEALAAILGPKIAHDITMDQGRHWAVVAAMARATTDQDAEAIATLRRHVKERAPDRRTEE